MQKKQIFFSKSDFSHWIIEKEIVQLTIAAFYKQYWILYKVYTCSAESKKNISKVYFFNTIFYKSPMHESVKNHDNKFYIPRLQFSELFWAQKGAGCWK